MVLRFLLEVSQLKKENQMNSGQEKRKHSHYFKSVAHLDVVDVYRVLDIFNVSDQAIGHAIKKLLVAGGRGGGKDFRRDLQEAIDTLLRRIEMIDEDAARLGQNNISIGAMLGAIAPQSEPDLFVWRSWSGGRIPVHEDAHVIAELAGGAEVQAKAGNLSWTHRTRPPTGSDIVRFRVVGL